jgi:hypothetical protein
MVSYLPRTWLKLYKHRLQIPILHILSTKRKWCYISLPTSGLFYSREATPDCKDLSKILTKAPPALTKAKVDAITAVVSVSGAADAIANRVKAGADASKTVHTVIDLSTAPPEVQQRYYKRLD